MEESMRTRLAGLRRLPRLVARRNISFFPALFVTAGVLATLAIAASLAVPAVAARESSATRASRGPGAAPADASAFQAACPAGFVLDFSGLPAGTILAEQYASFGIHISARANGEHPNAIIVFDSNDSGTHDPDLEVDIGNIAILAKELEDENGDGLVDLPDENNSGGAQVFAFDQPVHVESFFFIDKDHGTPDHAIAYNESDDVITTAEIPVGSNGSVQTITVGADNVRRLEVVYRDSGGLTGILIRCPQSNPTPTPSPQVRRPPDPTPTIVSEVFLPPTLPSTLPPTGGHPGPALP